MIFIMILIRLLPHGALILLCALIPTRTKTVYSRHGGQTENVKTHRLKKITHGGRNATVRCGHTPFILLILLSLFRDKLPNSKLVVLVPKCCIEINLNFLK